MLCEHADKSCLGLNAPNGTPTFRHAPLTFTTHIVRRADCKKCLSRFTAVTYCLSLPTRHQHFPESGTSFAAAEMKRLYEYDVSEDCGFQAR